MKTTGRHYSSRKRNVRPGSWIRQFAALLAFSLPPFAALAENVDVDNYYNPDLVEIPVNAVPERVLDAALAAKPGVYMTRVTRSLEGDDDHYYTFEGSQVGRYWIIVVRADGQVIKVREEEDAPPLRRD